MKAVLKRVMGGKVIKPIKLDLSEAFDSEGRLKDKEALRRDEEAVQVRDTGKS